MNKLQSEEKQRKEKNFPVFFTIQYYSEEYKKAVQSVSPINDLTLKQLKDALFLCNICTMLMIVEVIHKTGGGK